MPSEGTEIAAGISQGQGKKHQPGAHNGRCRGHKPAVDGQGQQDESNLGGHGNEAPGDHHRTGQEQRGRRIPSPHENQPRLDNLAKQENATTPSSGGLAKQENTTTPTSGGRIGVDSQCQPQHMVHSTTIEETIPSNEPAIDGPGHHDDNKVGAHGAAIGSLQRGPHEPRVTP